MRLQAISSVRRQKGWGRRANPREVYGIGTDGMGRRSLRRADGPFAKANSFENDTAPRSQTIWQPRRPEPPHSPTEMRQDIGNDDFAALTA